MDAHNLWRWLGESFLLNLLNELKHIHARKMAYFQGLEGRFIERVLPTKEVK